MKNLLISLTVFLLLSCGRNEKHEDQKINSGELIQSSKVKLNQTNQEIRSLLLHHLYVKDFKKVNQEDILKLTAGINQNYLKLFPILIKSSKENYDVYALPRYADKNYINEVVLSNTFSNRALFQEDLRIGGLTIVIDFEEDEIRYNEQNFQKKTIEFKNFKDIKFFNLTKFQKVSFLSVKKEIYLPKIVKVKRTKVQKGKCSDGEFTRACHCEYEIDLPTSAYELEYSENLNLENAKINFESGENLTKTIEGIPLNNECVITPKEEVSFKPIWAYSGKILIQGDQASEVFIDSSLQINL